MRALVAYVSGHGFGHFTRTEAVLERVAREGVAVHLRTDERALILARRATWAASVAEVETGPGAVQRGPLEVDVRATLDAALAHVERLEEIAAREARAIRELGAQLVYADVPPVAFLAAEEAGVPAVALGNFTWSWTYEGYAHHDARFLEVAARLASLEKRAVLALELPFSGGFEHFRRREALPLVARPPTRSREEGRRLLPISRDETRPVVLISFGGFGDALDLTRAARRNPKFFFVAFAPGPGSDNLATLAHDHGLPHQDLVLAADALLGKPGYGTVAEAIVAQRPYVITPRGEFREFGVLVRGIEESLPHAHLATDELLAGHWTEALERALAAPHPGRVWGTDGAEVAAAHVLRLL